MNSKRKYIESNLPLVQKMIDLNCPKSEIARILNVKYDTLNKALIELGINYKGNKNRKGISHKESQKNIDLYLRNQVRINASVLRKKLILNGIKEKKCECCGNTQWMGKNIPLELRHINMNHYDNRLENLQILCANCHAIAHDYSNSKNKPMSEINYDLLNDIECNNKPKEQLISIHDAKSIKEKTKHVCVLCGKPLKQSRQKFCSIKCARKASEKFSPSSTELLKKK